MNELKDFLLEQGKTIYEAMNTIDRSGLGIVFIIDQKKTLLGTITDGDIRKALRNGTDVHSPVDYIMNKNPLKVDEFFSGDNIKEEAKKREFAKFYSLKIPIVNNLNQIVNIIVHQVGTAEFRLLHEIQTSLQENIKKVLVVGGAGYLGSVLCRKLLQAGYKVRVLDLLLFGEEPLVELKTDPNFELIPGDLRDISTVTKALENIEAVIHLAAIVGDPASKNEPLHTIETNYLATLMLAQACKYHQINRFIFASTCSVYGQADGILDETSPLNPVSLYARSKIESEKAILNLTDGNFSPTILRMSTLHGLSPRMRFDLVVNIFAMKAATENKITLFGGDQWRPLLHVEDAAEAYIKCLRTPIEDVRGEVFNVGSEEQNVQIKKLGEMVKNLFPQTSLIISPKETIEGKDDPRNYQVSFTKIQNKLKFTATKGISHSLQEIYQAVSRGEIANVKDQKYYNSV